MWTKISDCIFFYSSGFSHSQMSEKITNSQIQLCACVVFVDFRVSMNMVCCVFLFSLYRISCTYLEKFSQGEVFIWTKWMNMAFKMQTHFLKSDSTPHNLFLRLTFTSLLSFDLTAASLKLFSELGGSPHQVAFSSQWKPHNYSSLGVNTIS